MAQSNKLLGDFQLSGIPPAPRGVPQIDVSFNIDANGILSVSAKDKASGKEQCITVTGSSNLNKSDVERMVQEAAANAEADRQAREKAESRNKADQLIYSTERSLTDLGDKVSADEKTDIESKIAALRTAVETGEQDKITPAMTELEQASYGLSERLYKEASASENSANGTGDTTGSQDQAPKDDVIDAEFKSEA